MSVIHPHPCGAAGADKDICIRNSPTAMTANEPPPTHASWDHQGQGRGGAGSLLQTLILSHAGARTIMQTVSNQFDADVKQSSRLG